MILDQLVANITKIRHALDYPMDEILVCYCHPHIFEPCPLSKNLLDEELNLLEYNVM
jgi:hypothetical protein